MALFVANNGSLQTVNGIYYGMAEDYINATLFHNLVPKTATEIKFLYASDNPDLTGYQRIGYCDDNNYIEVWNSGTKYILINTRKNYIYAPVNCSSFLTGYTALTTCILNNFDTRNVTNMNALFYKCSSLTSLDLSGFNTQKVRNMQQVFANCSSFTSLDLSSFDTANVIDMWAMFASCSRLQQIISYSFIKNSSLASANMFAFCTSLVGGNGTTYSSSNVTAEYARVDGENGLAGYFTAPTN